MTYDPSTGSQSVWVRLVKSGNQAIPNATTTAVAFDQQDFAPTGAALSHSTSSNNSRVTINTNGYVKFFAAALFAASASGTVRYVSVRKNASTTLSALQLNPPTAPNFAALVFSGMEKVTAGDYVELMVYQDV